MTLHAKSGNGPPGAAPESLNEHYTDTSSGYQYFAKGTSSAADWVWMGRAAPATSSPSSGGDGALTLDLAISTVFEVTLTEDTTLTFSTDLAAGTAGSFTLILKQDGTGGWAVTWPGSVLWSGGITPSLSTAANAIDLLTFVTTDGGGNWHGFLAGKGMS